MTHENFMQIAIDEAKKAEQTSLLPIASIIVQNDLVIAIACSTGLITHNDLNCIIAAGQKLNKSNLSECSLYSTIEPCSMCMGGAHWYGLKKIFFGAYQEDIRTNDYGLEGYHAIEMGRRFNPRVLVTGGIMRKECAELMKNIKNWTPIK